MSFYINNNNNKKPQCINPRQLNNICEKVLIEAKRIFDACIFRTDNEPFTLSLTNFDPATPTYPLTFVSVIDDPNKDVVVNSINIDRTDCRGNFANVTVNVTVPLLVNFVDANDVEGTAETSITVTKTAILCVPKESLTPINIEVVARFLSTIGTFTDETTLNITGCLQLIIKVTGIVDLLIPTFGYPCIPLCNGVDDNCSQLFNQPLYPNS